MPATTDIVVQADEGDRRAGELERQRERAARDFCPILDRRQFPCAGSESRDSLPRAALLPSQGLYGLPLCVIVLNISAWSIWSAIQGPKPDPCVAVDEGCCWLHQWSSSVRPHAQHDGRRRPGLRASCLNDASV